MAHEIPGLRPLGAVTSPDGRTSPRVAFFAPGFPAVRCNHLWSAALAALKVQWARLTRAENSAKEQKEKSPGNVNFLVVALAGCFLIVTVLHHTIPHRSVFWHNFFQWLYFGLAMIAAGRFGLRGGLLAAAAALIGYIPHLTEPESNVAFENYSAQLLVLFITSAVIGILTDRERYRRDQLQTALDELEQAHRDLRAGADQLRRADRLSALGELSASLAHEIRNPLASIQGAMSALDHSGTNDETCRELRQIIWKECGRLQHLLAGMLDFARPHGAAYRAVDVTQTFNSVVNLVAPAAAKSSVSLRKDVAPGIPSLQCDPEQLTQVILNLTLNAIQAMPGGGQIVLSACQEGSNMLLQVRDEGVGIDGEDVDRIFNPFFTTKKNGTGLGLAVAHGIVNQHGGRIEAEKNADDGMTFSVSLPLRRSATIRPEEAIAARLVRPKA